MSLLYYLLSKTNNINKHAHKYSNNNNNSMNIDNDKNINDIMVLVNNMINVAHKQS